MKRYKKNDISTNIYYTFMLIFLIILEVIDTFSFLKLFFIVYFFITLIYSYRFSFYSIKNQKFSIPLAENIDILKIKSIHKRKFIFLDKYYFDFKLSQYRWISIFPLQSNFNNIINDIIEINPNIIIKEYKSYNEHF